MRALSRVITRARLPSLTMPSSTTSSSPPADTSTSTTADTSTSTTADTSTSTAANASTTSTAALPSPDTTTATATLNVGSSAKLDALGPLVVNTDGTLSRIANWAAMAPIERDNTLRVLVKRNKLRLAALKQARGEETAPDSKTDS